MWWELVRKNIFEDFIKIRRKQIRESIVHLGMSKEIERYIWNTVSNHKRGYATPRIPYLLEAFLLSEKLLKNGFFCSSIIS